MPPLIYKFYNSSPDAWEAMLLECKKAKSSIYIEQYIFASDIIGNQFIEVLKEKRKQGVVVKILLDMVGSYDIYTSPVPEELNNLGIEVKFFNIISPWRLHYITSWIFRDHRKIVLIDEKIGFTGGLGIRDNMTFWLDTTARLEGSVAEEMKGSFLEMWKMADKKTFLSRIRVMRENLKRKNFVTNDPYFRRRYFYRTMIEAIRNAKKYIYITNPYFIPDHRLHRVIKLAVRRKVEVKIIIPEKFDVLLIGSGVESTLDTLLKDGVKIFRYQPTFIHSKTMVIDNDWATFGSFNLDNLSLLYNHEANVITFDKKCVEDLTVQFFTDLKNSKELTYSEWGKRPVTSKIREFIIARIRWIL